MLEHQEIGNRKPSQLIRYLRNLAGETATEEVIRAIWMKGLPAYLQLILASQQNSQLDDVATLADAIMDMQLRATHSSPPATIAETSASPQQSNIVDLFRQALEPLTQQIAALSTRINQQGSYQRHRSRSRSHGRGDNSSGRSNSTSRSKNSNNSVCWYHRRHGDKAERYICTRPCSYDSENGSRHR